jgi:hypothetical protein
VLRESTILAWRQAAVPNFPAIPIFVDVEIDELKKGNWAPLAINEIEAKKGSTRAVRELLRRLSQVPQGTTDTPLAQLVEQIARELRPLDAQPKSLADAQAALGAIELVGPFGDPIRQLAERILGADFATLFALLHVLPRAFEYDAIKRIIKIVLPFLWRTRAPARSRQPPSDPKDSAP